MTSLFCQWTDSGGFLTCSQCGAEIKKRDEEPPLSGCPEGARRNGMPFHAILTAGSVKKYSPAVNKSGPGTELKKMFLSWGIKPSAGCKCNQRSLQMDSWGPDECEQRMEEIIGWLRDEATARGLPFVETVARMFVRRAIAKARKQDAK